jgi:hypothetical protein
MRQLGFQFGAMALCYNYTEDVHEYNYIDARQRQLVLDNAVRRPATSSRGRTNSSSTYLG